jgi:hypothetical protein
MLAAAVHSPAVFFVLLQVSLFALDMLIVSEPALSAAATSWLSISLISGTQQQDIQCTHTHVNADVALQAHIFTVGEAVNIPVKQQAQSRCTFQVSSANTALRNVA